MLPCRISGSLCTYTYTRYKAQICRVSRNTCDNPRNDHIINKPDLRCDKSSKLLSTWVVTLIQNTMNCCSKTFLVFGNHGTPLHVTRRLYSWDPAASQSNGSVSLYFFCLHNSLCLFLSSFPHLVWSMKCEYSELYLLNPFEAKPREAGYW